MTRIGTLLAAAVLAAALGPVPAAAQFETVEAFELKGAQNLIIVPENWNGSLFIYAHGYSADQRIIAPFPTDITPANFGTKLPTLFAATALPALFGYASATTTFRSVGWYVEDAIKDIENLRRYFVKKYGKPKYSYIWGHSGGGMVTATIAEVMPRTYDGAMPLCGPGAGGRRNFNAAFDLRVVFEHVCGGVPGAQFLCRVCSGGGRCLADGDCPAGETCGGPEEPPPPEDGLTRECTDFLLAHPDRFSEDALAPGGSFVVPPLTACFGDLTDATPPTPEQAARRALFLRTTQVAQSFVVSDMFFASIGMAEVVHRRTRGKHPWGNMGVDYAPPALTADERAALNADVYRKREDAAATEYMRRFYEPRGRTRSKVLTVHALDDGLVLPENEDKYRQAFEAAGTADQLVQLYTASGGHCGFIVELFPALNAMTAWVENGTKPSLASMRAACPTCDFTDALPGPWGLKVVERRQKGVPVRSLVCSGEPGDCPAGNTCVADRHRCK
ncbi:MAG TPA: DUF6351 family protein [Candidatus Binatia bacterium]|nr:DUF6351 family protein [Candidatus Binatia bacterium]